MNISEVACKLNWQLRNTFTCSLPRFRFNHFKPETVVENFTDQGKKRYKILKKTYSLDHWTSACTHQDYMESLYILDVCNHHLAQIHIEKKKGKNLDIGCKNWAYLPGLSSFSQGPWDGIELDVHRRYLNMTTRKRYGEYMAKHFPDCRYMAGSVEDLREQYSLITWFLPFVRPEPLKAWGLPARYFRPRQLLQHSWNILQQNGHLFVINQGLDEAKIQETLFSDLKIPAESLGEIQSIFSPYKKQRFGWLARKSIR